MSLPSARLSPGTGLAQPTQVLPGRVGVRDSALMVMIDFERVGAVLVRPSDGIDEANRRMIQRGVQLLLVVDAYRNVAGLITADDIFGEKPFEIMAARGCLRGDILVRDLMTPQDRLETFDLQDVQGARVGTIVATLVESSQSHALVVDRDDYGRQRVRGLFSLTQIARQLGVSIQSGDIARKRRKAEAQLAR